MSKDNFLHHNRGILSVLALIIGFFGIWIAIKLEQDSSTPIQWIILGIMVLFIFYVQFITGMNLEESRSRDDLAFNFEEKEIPKDIFSMDTPTIVKQIHNNLESPAENNDQIEFRDDIKETINQAIDEKKKVVYVVQPIIMAEKDLTDKLEEMKNDNTNPDNKTIQSGATGPVKELAQEEKGVVGYSTRLVPYRWRGMYDDIHSFAINHGAQTVDDIVKKILPYGHPFKKIENGPKLVAFDFGFLRMPESGFFAVKLPEPKKEDPKDNVEPEWKARE